MNKMNKMKRKVCAVLSFVSIICMAIVPAAAETENDAARQERIQAARQYAYLNLESASSEMKEKILSAREIIIYSSDGWCADGFSGTVTYADGTVERIPNFSELFPSDWDLPDDDCLDVTEYVNLEPVIEQDEFELLTAQNSPDINNVTPPPYDINANYNVYIPKYIEGQQTNPFTIFYHNGSYIRTTVTQLTASETCNIGYTNADTGKSIGWKPNLRPGEFCEITTGLSSDPFTCAVRTSTYDIPGYGILNVIQDQVQIAR